MMIRKWSEAGNAKWPWLSPVPSHTMSCPIYGQWTCNNILKYIRSFIPVDFKLLLATPLLICAALNLGSNAWNYVAVQGWWVEEVVVRLRPAEMSLN